MRTTSACLLLTFALLGALAGCNIRSESTPTVDKPVVEGGDKAMVAKTTTWPRKDWPGIDKPGMTKEQVRAKFGDPDSTYKDPEGRFYLWTYEKRSVDTEGSKKLDKKAILKIFIGNGPNGSDTTYSVEFIS